MIHEPQHLKILCIDDNKYMQQIYWISLNSMGFEDITAAANGAEALDLMRTNDFDLIFCDLAMGPVDGFEFLKTVRSGGEGANSEVPVIVVSGNADTTNIKASRDAGANEFLAKPVSVHSLFKRIEAVIEHSRPFQHTDDFIRLDRRRRVDEETGMTDRRAD